MSARLELDVATPERVNVALPVAGIGFRSLAYLIDALLLFAFWITVYFAFTYAVPDVLRAVLGLSNFTRALALLGFFITLYVYWTASEVLMHGQSPGKRLMHIRVVRADGSPVGLYESAVRNLVRVIDFLPVGYALGLLVMLTDARHRRLGDLVAGTLAIREETFDLGRYQSAVAGTGQALGAEDLELLTSFLARLADLSPETRVTLGRQLLQRFGGQAEGEAEVLAWLRARAAAR